VTSSPFVRIIGETVQTVDKRKLRRLITMKKIMSIVLGLSLVLGAYAFAQEDKKEAPKGEKGGKKGGKKEKKD
jgi:hypothetical protein